MFLRCKSFLHYVFALQDDFSLRFRAARRFYNMFSRCKSFLHNVFKLQGDFSLRFCDVLRFSSCVFCTTLCLCAVFLQCVTFQSYVFATFPEP